MRAVDSSILVKYFSREPGWERAREVILEGITTLDLAVKEVINALWKKVLRKEIDSNVALTIVRDLVESKPFPIESEEHYLVEAFGIAVESGITIYDALFIAFAKKKNLELVTSDIKQANVAKEYGLKVVLI